MKLCGVLFTTLLACCVAVENFNPAVPLVHRLSSRIKRQSSGGDPNLEGIFGGQNNNNNNGGNNGQFGQSSSSGSGTSNEQPQFGFGFSELGGTQSNNNNNGGFNNQGSFGNNGGGGGFGGNQGSFGSGSNAQSVQRPQTTQRTPLNQIALQTTISSTDCLRNCRNRLPQQYAPVCGSDNISYLNRQVFDCYTRECGQDVRVVYVGSCVTTRAPQ